jgi:Protein of unknown function (DUF3105)
MAKGGGPKRPSGERATRAPGSPLSLSRRQRRRVMWGAGVLAAVLAVAAGSILWARARPAPGEFVASLGNAHIQTADTPHVPYNSDPPTSGPHLPYIAPWGVHTRPIPRELQVHNLEDGGVVVQYRPECESQVLEPLKRLVTRYADHVVLAPYPGLDRCVALTAWTRIDKLDTVDEGRIIRFIDAYRGIDHHAR